MFRPAEFQGLGRIEKLYCEHPLGILHHLDKLGGCIGTHADVVFLTLG